MPHRAKPSEDEVAAPRQPAAWSRLALPAVVVLLLVGAAGAAIADGGALKQAGASLLGSTILAASQAPARGMIVTPAAALTAAPATRTAPTQPPAATRPPGTTPMGLSTATQLPGATLTGDQAGCTPYRQEPPDLLTYVSKDQGLPRDFRPADLAIVPLAQKNQAFRPIPLRRVVHQPLLEMLAAMNQAGLSVWVMSGFRSYGDQQLAYEKWQQLYPDRAPDISAVPGHSEHQLGTAVDFSTPYMVELFGDFFNVRFSKTPEGQWLGQQAANYGFTLSYPSGATQITGYAWEPWHYRYVGVLAQDLIRRDITLTQYIQECASR